jgi:hypothetical protein
MKILSDKFHEFHKVKISSITESVFTFILVYDECCAFVQ